MQTARSIFPLIFAVFCLTTLDNSEAKKPNKPNDGGTEAQLVKLQPVGSESSSANAINDAGIVVGQVDGFPCVWDSQESAPVFLPLAGGAGNAISISDDGEIVGHGNVGPRYWDNPFADPVDLPIPAEAATGVAQGISDEGVVVGEVYIPNENDVWEGWAAIWRITEDSIFGPVILETGGAHDVAMVAPGVHRLVGRSADQTYGHVATAWDLITNNDGTVTVLGRTVLIPDTSGEAFAITEQGDLTGIIKPANTAFVIRDGSLKLLPSGGKNEYGVGYDLNDTEVVGKTGTWWLADDMQATSWNSRNRRENLVQSYFDAGWEDSAAEGLNSFGVIVGSGTQGAWLLRRQ